MGIEIKGKPDAALEQVKAAMEEYLTRSPGAKIQLYRQNSVSIRIRIIDPSFKGLSKGERHDLIWPLIEKLPYELQQDISVLLLLTAEEMKESLMNIEFEDPSPSRL